MDAADSVYRRARSSYGFNLVLTSADADTETIDGAVSGARASVPDVSFVSPATRIGGDRWIVSVDCAKAERAQREALVRSIVDGLTAAGLSGQVRLSPSVDVGLYFTDFGAPCTLLAFEAAPGAVASWIGDVVPVVEQLTSPDPACRVSISASKMFDVGETSAVIGLLQSAARSEAGGVALFGADGNHVAVSVALDEPLVVSQEYGGDAEVAGANMLRVLDVLGPVRYAAVGFDTNWFAAQTHRWGIYEPEDRHTVNPQILRRWVDLFVLDAFPIQVLSEAHWNALSDPGALHGEPYRGGRLVRIGSVDEWLPGDDRARAARQAGRALLRGALPDEVRSAEWRAIRAAVADPR